MGADSKFIWELERMHTQFEELQQKISDPDTIKSPQYNEYLKEFGRMQKIMNVYTPFRDIQAKIDEDRELLADEDADAELKELAEEEIAEQEVESARLLEDIKNQVYMEEAQGDKVIMEIRAGTGGDEASLFASDLFRMYTGLCERRRWKYEVMDKTETDLKGYKNLIMSIRGKSCYNALQFESGGHRVQRIPVTESGGRIHTSAATVAVLPEAEDIEVNILPSDLIIETFRSSGPGGQSVNTMDSAVRITHKPSGTVVSCQDGKSQLTNKEQAMRILKTRIFERIKAEADKERGDMRRNQIGSGDRNERVRTYNFPQNRVTDHRINHSIYNLELFMTGDLDEMLTRLHEHFREKYFEEYADSK